MKSSARSTVSLLLAGLLFVVALASVLGGGAHQQALAYPAKHGHVKIKVWRGPSHGHKKYKHAPFGYHFSVDEGHHY